MRKWIKRILVAAIVLGIVGTAGAWYLRRENSQAVSFKTAEVTRGDLLVTIDASGTLEPEEVVDVGAQVAGQIVAFGTGADGKTVDYGSPVEQGAVLARIDEALPEADVSQAEAEVKSAQAGVQYAKANLEQLTAKFQQAERDWARAQKLGPSEALAQASYDAYQSAYETAKANVAVGEALILQAQASLAQAETSLWRAKRNLGYCTITSPVKGVIIDRRVNIGQGSSSQLQKSIASMGANVLLVMPGSTTSSGVSQGTGSTVTLRPEDCAAIAAECPSIRAVAPMVRARTQIVYGNLNWVPDSMYGTTAAFLEIRDWTPLAEGEPFTERDVLSANRVCLLGQTIVKELFQGESAIGKVIRVNNVPLRVAGVLQSKGANMVGMDQDDVLIAPWAVVKYRIAGSTLSSTNQSASSGSDSTYSRSQLYPSNPPSLYPEQSETQTENNPMLVRFTSVDTIMAAAYSADQIPSAMQEMTEVLRREHNLRTGQADDFEIRDMAEMTSTLSSTTTLMTNLLLSVALISLVVGGVGIMNIMLVSVTERTREIGLRMAVGARGRDILRQFLIEAVLLCLVGGAMGILLGHGGSLLVQTLLRWPVETSPAAIAAAVLVSASVGIVFGFYPAWKASRLDPIDALRYE
jgi:ABC-type antimicrobial peptide transport system permease subunit